MRTRLALGLALLLATACVDSTAPTGVTREAHVNQSMAPTPQDFAVSMPGVPLGPGVTADLVAHVYVDERAKQCDSRGTVLAINGFAHTAATWGPLTDVIFDSPPSLVCRIVALDLPGHGPSGLPSGTLFGLLAMEHYAGAVLGALDRLRAEGLAPRAILAHSQGGIIVQLAQQLLVDGGSSLRRAHGIDAVVLLAPTMPAALPWAFAENPATLQLLGSLLTADATLGPHIAIPDALWRVLFFSRLDFSLVSTAPTEAEIASRGYNAPEPLVSAVQLLGVFGATRPAIQPGIFSLWKGTLLSVLAFEQDQIVRPEEARALHAHLTGLRLGLGFLTIGGSEAVHDMYVSDPAALRAGIRDALR